MFLCLMKRINETNEREQSDKIAKSKDCIKIVVCMQNICTVLYLFCNWVYDNCLIVLLLYSCFATNSDSTRSGYWTQWNWSYSVWFLFAVGCLFISSWKPFSSIASGVSSRLSFEWRRKPTLNTHKKHAPNKTKNPLKVYYYFACSLNAHT